MDRRRLFWITAIALMSAALAWHAWNSACDHDEIEHLHAAWLVGQGAEPFEDFLEQHHPTVWYAIAPLTKAIPSPRPLVFASRILHLAGLAAFIALFVAAARELYPGCRARWPALLLVSSFTFTRNMMEVRPDPWMNILAFAGLLLWLIHLERGGWLRALLAGLLFGLAIAVLQKAAVVLVLVAAASVTAPLVRGDWRGTGERLAGVVIMAAGAAIPVAALFALMWAAGLWDEFYFWNYTFNRFFYLNAVLAGNFTIAKTAWNGFVRNPALWIAGLAGLLLMARRLWGERREADGAWDARFVIAFVAAGYFASLAMSRMPFDQYLIVWLPLIALASIEVYLWLRSLEIGFVYEAAGILMAVELIVIAMAYPPDAPYQSVRERVLKDTGREQSVVVPPVRHPIVRRDGTYFWYNGQMIAGAYEQYCMHEGCDARAMERDESLWRETRPEFVFIDEENPNQQPYGWEGRKDDYEPAGIEGLFRLRR